ncbi:zinc finger, CCHC-type containing protein [Tanacetum coccineum]
MERGFLSSKGCGGGRGVKEKSGGSIDVSVKVNNEVDEGTTTSSNVATNTHGSTKDTTQVTSVMSSAADGPVLSRSGGHMVDENVGQTPSNSTDNPNKGTSYANLFTGESCKKSVNFRNLFTSGENKVDVVVLVESIRAISERFTNTAYGFFLGKRVAYRVVANYVRNTWGKYGLVKSMLNSSTGIFTFHFNYLEGLDAILENGPWFIRNNPLILKKWNPDVNLLKEDVGGKIVAGSIIGGLKDTQEMLDFSTKHGVTANVEIIPIDYVNTAMDRILNFAFDVLAFFAEAFAFRGESYTWADCFTDLVFQVSTDNPWRWRSYDVRKGVNNRIMLTVDILLVVVKESKKGQVGDAGAIVASVLPSFCQAILPIDETGRLAYRGGKIVAGSIIGGLKDTQEMLDFATKHGIAANVEMIPIDYVNTAMDRILNFSFDWHFLLKHLRLEENPILGRIVLPIWCFRFRLIIHGGGGHMMLEQSIHTRAADFNSKCIRNQAHDY